RASSSVAASATARTHGSSRASTARRLSTSLWVVPGAARVASIRASSHSGRRSQTRPTRHSRETLRFTIGIAKLFTLEHYWVSAARPVCRRSQMRMLVLEMGRQEWSVRHSSFAVGVGDRRVMVLAMPSNRNVGRPKQFAEVKTERSALIAELASRYADLWHARGA